MQGPNVKKLIVRRMSAIAVPKGGGMSDALGFLQSPDRLAAAAKEATKFAEDAIAAVRLSAGGTYANATDEDIAETILREVEARK